MRMRENGEGRKRANNEPWVDQTQPRFLTSSLALCTHLIAKQIGGIHVHCVISARLVVIIDWRLNSRGGVAECAWRVVLQNTWQMSIKGGEGCYDQFTWKCIWNPNQVQALYGMIDGLYGSVGDVIIQFKLHITTARRYVLPLITKIRVSHK